MPTPPTSAAIIMKQLTAIAMGAAAPLLGLPVAEGRGVEEELAAAFGIGKLLEILRLNRADTTRHALVA